MGVSTIRTLSMDAVQQANSGHPGTAMAMAPVVYTLWQRHLRFDPLDPIWPNRDRFVLSIGHASMLLYSMLHLAGVKGGESGVRDGRCADGHAQRDRCAPRSSTTRIQLRLPRSSGRSISPARC
jgi:transketolase